MDSCRGSDPHVQFHVRSVCRFGDSFRVATVWRNHDAFVSLRQDLRRLLATCGRQHEDTAGLLPFKESGSAFRRLDLESRRLHLHKFLRAAVFWVPDLLSRDAPPAAHAGPVSSAKLHEEIWTIAARCGSAPLRRRAPRQLATGHSRASLALCTCHST